MERVKQLLVFFVFITMASAVTYAAGDWSSWLYEVTTGRQAGGESLAIQNAVQDSPRTVTTISVSHSPSSPTPLDTITITAITSGGRAYDGVIYLDDKPLRTIEFCDNTVCGFRATVSNLPDKRSYYYYATALSGGVTIRSGTQRFSVTAGLPIIEYFTAEPVRISPGQSSTLRWAIRNATLATISNIGSINPEKGSVVVTPTKTTTYFLTADNDVGPVNKNLTIIVDATTESKLKVSHSPENPVVNEQVTFTVRSASALTDVVVYVGGNPLKTQRVCLSGLDVTGKGVAGLIDRKPTQCSTAGQMCGGIAAIQCCSGLTCILDGTYPDAGGKCVSNTNREVCTYVATSPLSAGNHVYYATAYINGKPVQSARATVKVSSAFFVVHSPESPKSTDRITFTAYSRELLTGVQLYLDNDNLEKPVTVLKMTTTCKPVVSNAQDARRCAYTATTQLANGGYTYYATGSTDPGNTERPTRLMTTDTNKLTVRDTSLKIIVSYSPKEPGPNDRIIFTAKLGPALTNAGSSDNDIGIIVIGLTTGSETIDYTQLTDVVLHIGDSDIKMQKICLSAAGVATTTPELEGGNYGDTSGVKTPGTNAGLIDKKPLCSFTASTSLAAGSYRYYVTGTYGNRDVTSDTGVIKVGETTRPKLRLYFSPKEPLSNEDILFTVQPSTDAMTGVQIYVDDIAVKTEPVCIQTFAQADPTCSYRATKSLLAGKHSFYATANYMSKVIKSDVVSFVVVDPSISKFIHVYHSPESPMSGETITFSAASRLDLDNVVMYVGGTALKTQKVCLSSEDIDTDVTDRLRPTCRYIATTSLKPGKYSYYAVGYYGQKMVRSESRRVTVYSQEVPKFDVSNSPENPTIGEKITFDAYSPDVSLTDVLIYVDGRAMKTEMTCLKSIPGGCHYTATSESLKAGLHTYYAQGRYNKRLITTETKKFYVVAREIGHVRIGHSPYYPTMFDTITFFARTNVKLTDMTMYLDGDAMKMQLTCTQLANSINSYKCAYIVKVPGLKPGDHKYYAVGTGVDGVKYGSGARTLTVSDEINTLNIPDELSKEDAYEVAQILDFSDVINGINIAPQGAVYMNYPKSSAAVEYDDAYVYVPGDLDILAKPKYDDIASWPDTEYDKYRSFETDSQNSCPRDPSCK